MIYNKKDKKLTNLPKHKLTSRGINFQIYNVNKKNKTVLNLIKISFKNKK